MNFFAQQARAQRNTVWLLVLLAAAVICLILITTLVTATAWYFSQSPFRSSPVGLPLSLAAYLAEALTSNVLFYTAAGVLLMVCGGSLYKTLQLGGSGEKVAVALGGRRLDSSTREPSERQLLNVIEEMAIASGNPVPLVYVLEDDSINAFAAGTDRRNAVIGVTRGCMRLLTREELQGVMAHEFSHIHFGDMRINLRLVAVLHGILIIGLSGSLLLRSSMYGGRNKNRGVQTGLGLALLILGYGGIFFANLIKAAVSRQREFLADASAVQFTRNPQGIADALKKIGGLSNHALLSSPVAAQYSHLYFGQGINTAFESIMATHPPLAVRIKKLQPHWDGTFIRPTATPARPSPTTDQLGGAAPRMPLAAIVSGFDSTLASIGNPTSRNLAQAQSLIKQLPATVIDAARDPFSARALIYSLLIDTESSACERKQIGILQERAHLATFTAFKSLLGEVRALPRSHQLALIDLAVPALKLQSGIQLGGFKENLVALIQADDRVALFEWCLYRIVTAATEKRQTSSRSTLHDLQPAIAVVIAAACYSGGTSDTEAAYRAAEDKLPNIRLKRIPVTEVTFQQLDTAIAALAQLKPLHKPSLLKAVAACISADNKVKAEEIELLRAIADCLDCPVPLHKA